MPVAETPEPPPDLILECVERIEADGLAALEAVCRRHPEHAAGLRAALAALLRSRLVSPPPRAMPQRIGEFALVREIGRGGMGVVYEAMQTSLGRAVALKVLPQHLAMDDQANARFRREATTAASLQHRGIAQVYAVGDEDWCSYLAMELIEGAPLDRVLAVLRSQPVGSLDGLAMANAVAQLSGGPRPERAGRARTHVLAVAELGAQMAEALAVAHQEGVVHRDVKPANIMLRCDGTAVLTDFGLARREDDPRLTRSGVFAGTPFYTSPEQTTGGDVDGRADVFSLAATLYELLTLQLPFPGGSSEEVLQAIRTREPIDMRRHHHAVPRDLVAIVQRALEKEPSRRYPDAATFAADLRAFAAGRPVAARPISVLGRVQRWSRRQPLRAALVASFACGVPLVLGLAAYVLANHGVVQAAERQQVRDAAEAAVLRGYVAFGEGRLADAERQLRSAVELQPDDVEAWAGLSQVAVQGRRAAVPAVLRDLEAHAALLAGSRTLQRCRLQLREATGDAAATAQLQEFGPPQEPLESFWVGMRMLAMAMRTSKVEDAKVAYQHLQDAVVGSPEARPAFVFWMGAAAGEVGDEAGARRAAAALQRLWPGTGFTAAGVGLALHHVDTSAAIAAYRRAVELLPDQTMVRNNLANALLDDGQREASIAIRRQLVRDFPDYAVARYNLGRALFYDRDFDGALEQLRAAVKLEPKARGNHHYLIWALSRVGKGDEALAAAQAAIALLPDEALLWRDLANVHSDAGDLRLAMAPAEKALALAPDDPANLELLGDLHAGLGEDLEARALYERCIACSQEGRQRQAAREQLIRFLLRGPGRSAGPDPAAALVLALELARDTGERDPWVLQLLADAQQRNQQVGAAVASLDCALRLCADSPDEKLQRLHAALRKDRDTLARRLPATK